MGNKIFHIKPRRQGQLSSILAPIATHSSTSVLPPVTPRQASLSSSLSTVTIHSSGYVDPGSRSASTQKTLTPVSLSSSGQTTSSGSSINLSAPTITGTRGGTLTAHPGTWSGSTSTSGRWYSDGTATSNTSLSYTDVDTSSSLEYRETSLPGNVNASAYRGALATATSITFLDSSKSANTSLSNGNLTATQSSNPADPWPAPIEHVNTQGVSGKFYFECRVDGAFNSTIGVSLMDAVYLWDGVWPGNTNSHGFSWLNDGSIGGTWTSSLAYTTGDTLCIALDVDNKHIYVAKNATPTLTGGYSLSGMTAPIKIAQTGQFDVEIGTFNFGGSAFAYSPPAGYSAPASTSVSAFINPVGSRQIGCYKADVSAHSTVPGTTGLQYKIELQSGQLIQTWTSLTNGSGTSTFAPFAYEGQSLRVLARNIGGTLSVSEATSPPVPYSLVEDLRIGLNDGFWNYWAHQVLGRDLFEGIPNHPSDSMLLSDPAFQYYHSNGLLPPGNTYPKYAHWDEVYNPTQLYPSISDPSSDDYRVCVYNGVQWVRTNHTPRSGVAPDPTDSSGATSGWARYGFADGSVIGMDTRGWPTKHPDDSNLVINLVPSWDGFKSSRYPVTVHCKTQPNVNIGILNPAGITKTNVNLAAGTFDLVYSGPTRAFFWIDRSTPISAGFFLSGIPDYESGSPASDIGAPYVNKDKIQDYVPFHAMRNMTGQLTNRTWTGIHNGMTAANSVPTGGRRLWKYNVDMANQAGHKAIWVNIHDVADDTYTDAMAQFYLDNLNPGIVVYLELSNEEWNSSFWQSGDLQQRAVDAGLTASQLHARETKAMSIRWRNIWSAAGHLDRLKTILAWQQNINTDIGAMLDFENTYQYVDYYSFATYFGIQNYDLFPAAAHTAVVNNDYPAFEAAVDSTMRTKSDASVTGIRSFYDYLPVYNLSKGRDKSAIKFAAYEGSPEVLILDGWNWDSLGAGMSTRATDFIRRYKRSAAMGVTYARHIDNIKNICPHLWMVFDYQGDASGWAQMDRVGNETDEPYASLKTKALLYN